MGKGFFQWCGRRWLRGLSVDGRAVKVAMRVAEGFTSGWGSCEGG